MILGKLIDRNARIFPRKEAFVFKDQRVTFAEFRNRVNQIVNALMAVGVKKGDRIALLSHNCISYFELYGAAEKGGFILAPLNYRLTARELLCLIQDAEAETVFLQSKFVTTINSIREQLTTVKRYICLDDIVPDMLSYESLLKEYSSDEPCVEVHEDDPVYIIYTSGTTGVPRGALFTHRAQYQATNNSALELGLRIGDKTLAMKPLYHTGGHTMTHAHFYRGCTIVLTDGFKPEETLRLVEREKITILQTVPTMISDLLNLPALEQYDTTSLRMMFYAASPMPVSLLRKAIQRWGCIFFQSYGLTENCPIATTLPIEDHIIDGPEHLTRRLASCGRPSINCDIRVVRDDGNEVQVGEVGEIIIRSGQLMKEYWNKPELTAEVIKNGWLYTGDMATVDEESYIYVVDRKKDMIVSGGENVYPREVEEILYAHPSIRESSVFGVPHQKWVEAVHAAVVLKEGHSITAEEIIVYCKQYLAGYKVPKSIQFLTQLPRNSTGKISKNELRENYCQGGCN